MSVSIVLLSLLGSNFFCRDLFWCGIAGLVSLVLDQIQILQLGIVCFREIVHVVACAIPERDEDPGRCESVADPFGVPARDGQAMRARVEQKVERHVDQGRLVAGRVKELFRPLNVVE